MQVFFSVCAGEKWQRIIGPFMKKKRPYGIEGGGESALRESVG